VAAKIEDGSDATEVRVSVDGELLIERLDGKAVPIDPGERRFDFELAGHAPVQKRLVIREGEKARQIEVEFAPAPSSSDGRPEQRIAAYALGGAAALGLGLFAFFGVRGNSRLSDLDERGCKPSCPQEDVDAVKSDYRTANVLLAVSLVTLAAGVCVFATSWVGSDEPVDTARLELTLGPTVGGMNAALGWVF